MSGIYIKDMEMPKERESFPITIKYNGLVFDTETGIQIAEAYEVPDHGRLIDADALIAECLRDGGFWSPSKYEINNAPTIIPADHADKREVKWREWNTFCPADHADEESV